MTKDEYEADHGNEEHSKEDRSHRPYGDRKEDRQWGRVTIPAAAVKEEHENSILIYMPDNSFYGSRVIFLPKRFTEKDSKGSVVYRFNRTWGITLKGRDDDDDILISTGEFEDLITNGEWTKPSGSFKKKQTSPRSSYPKKRR